MNSFQYICILVVCATTKMSFSNVIPSTGSNEPVTVPTTLSSQEVASLKLIFGNCTTLLHIAESNMNNTFNYVCKRWCESYNQPAVRCCSTIHSLAATGDNQNSEDEKTSSSEDKLEQIYTTVNKYREIVQILAQHAEKNLCQIHWSRGIPCVYPTNCATTKDDKEKTFCYYRNVKINMDSVWLLLKDALNLINRESQTVTSSTSEDPSGEMMEGLADLMNLSRALITIQEVTTSLKTLQNWN